VGAGIRGPTSREGDERSREDDDWHTRVESTARLTDESFADKADAAVAARAGVSGAREPA
jgi:hypothetical protein